jgi:hypothetical protein
MTADGSRHLTHKPSPHILERKTIIQVTNQPREATWTDTPKVSEQNEIDPA